jgi:hypothetical protein
MVSALTMKQGGERRQDRPAGGRNLFESMCLDGARRTSDHRESSSLGPASQRAAAQTPRAILIFPSDPSGHSQVQAQSSRWAGARMKVTISITGGTCQNSFQAALSHRSDLPLSKDDVVGLAHGLNGVARYLTAPHAYQIQPMTVLIRSWMMKGGMSLVDTDTAPRTASRDNEKHDQDGGGQRWGCVVSRSHRARRRSSHYRTAQS